MSAAKLTEKIGFETILPVRVRAKVADKIWFHITIPSPLAELLDLKEGDQVGVKFLQVYRKVEE